MAACVAALLYFLLFFLQVVVLNEMKAFTFPGLLVVVSW